MKIRLHCTYYNEKREKQGEPGDVLELTKREAELLLKGGSAELVEPPKRSEREELTVSLEADLTRGKEPTTWDAFSRIAR